MSTSASKSRLNELHEMLAEVLIEDLKQSIADKIPLPAANLGVIRQFLKDNEISASLEADDMRQLRDAFADDLASKRAAKQGALAAALSDDSMDVILM